jgi:hypothetical protein
MQVKSVDQTWVKRGGPDAGRESDDAAPVAVWKAPSVTRSAREYVMHSGREAGSMEVKSVQSRNIPSRGGTMQLKSDTVHSTVVKPPVLSRTW